MALSRRELAFGLATGLGAFATGSRDEDENEAFCPDIEFSSDGLSFRIDYDLEPDSITVHTTDGTAYEFTDEMATEGGYRRGWSELHIDDGWYGPIERVSVSRGPKTIAVENDDELSLEVTCSLWKTPDTRPGDFRMSYENASLMYDPPMGDLSEYGSPGRQLQSVEDVSSELYINFENRTDCEPEEDVAVVFDCTSVTVHPEEFVNGVEEIYRPQLTFSDGTQERLGDRERLFEPPVTFAGTGENERKVIERLHFWNDTGGEANFTYWNPDVDGCDDEASGTDGDSDEENGDDSDEENGGDSDEENDESGEDTERTREEMDDGNDDPVNSSARSNDVTGESTEESGQTDGGDEEPSEDPGQVDGESTENTERAGNGSTENTEREDNGSTENTERAGNGSTENTEREDNGSAENPERVDDGTTVDEMSGMGVVSGVSAVGVATYLTARRSQRSSSEETDSRRRD